MLNSNVQSFQNGVDTLYNKCVSCGSTPSDKTPTALSTSIQSIYTNRYNAGYNAAGGDIKHTINISVSRTVNDPSNSIYQYVSVKLTDSNGTVLYNKSLPNSWYQTASSMTGSITV